MPELTVQDMAAKLRSERFDRAAPTGQALTDPIIDTPMSVTLDELRPYDLNPRIARNPKYDEIKASIRERGLDAPPAITRRPGEPHFIIRNGGNTRLSILRELWAETKDEKFFRIPCLFRPWSARGEIVALTGHLAENELHGELSFIERALGVEKARELYEQEIGKPLSQRELARRLTADGYPISHTLVNRMQDTVRHLLPAIPTVLYGGLGRPQVERLATLRKASARVWERHAGGAQPTVDFQTLFHDVLSSLDTEPERFSAQRVQDQLLRQMARLLASDYDTLALEIIDAEGIADALGRDPAGQPSLNAPFPIANRATPRLQLTTSPSNAAHAPAPSGRPSTPTATPTRPARAAKEAPGDPIDDDEWDTDSETETDSPSDESEGTSPEPDVIAMENENPAFFDPVAQTGASEARGRDAASDPPHTEPSLDNPRRLRAQIARLAADIASEGSLAHRIKATEDGVGYICAPERTRSKEPSLSPFQRALLALLTAMSAPYAPHADAGANRERAPAHAGGELGLLLQGSPTRDASEVTMQRLSDAGLEKLFRSICLARRLMDLESAGRKPGDEDTV
jgi:ParB family protein of integrating conjugative element (PFGI_1 class)